jgi:hypothetical protein
MMEKKTIFSTNVAGKTGYLPADLWLSPYASINSKWVKDLDIRPATLKLVQKRAGNTLKQQA